MHNEFPKRFQDLANNVYIYVYAHPEIAAQYLSGDLAPEAVTLSSDFAYLIDVTIQDYALVNMQGFAYLIEELDSMTVTFDKRFPMPGNEQGQRAAAPIWSARVRYSSTSPYPSTTCGSVRPAVTTATWIVSVSFEQIATQTLRSEVSRKFPDLANMMQDSVWTSLSLDFLAFLADRLRSGVSIQELVDLRRRSSTQATPTGATLPV